jgi:hypothetical protein
MGLLESLNGWINEIRAGMAKKPVTMRRITLNDVLVNDELISSDESNTHLVELLTRRKELQDKIAPYLKSQNFAKAAEIRDELQPELNRINKKLTGHIEAAIFKSGNLLALAESGDIVYTSEYLIRQFFDLEFTSEKELEPIIIPTPTMTFEDIIQHGLNYSPKKNEQSKNKK